VKESKGDYLIQQQRKIFNTEGDRATIGEVFTDGKYFCYCLEDEVRFDGVKVFGKTAIPAIVYDVVITFSPHFKRDTIQLYNRSDLSIQHEGVRFTGVRVHGGNKAIDTLGCPLVAKNTDGIKIWSTMEKEILALVKQKISEGYDVKWSIENKPFNPTLDNILR